MRTALTSTTTATTAMATATAPGPTGREGRGRRRAADGVVARSGARAGVARVAGPGVLESPALDVVRPNGAERPRGGVDPAVRSPREVGPVDVAAVDDLPATTAGDTVDRAQQSTRGVTRLGQALLLDEGGERVVPGVARRDRHAPDHLVAGRATEVEHEGDRDLPGRTGGVGGVGEGPEGEGPGQREGRRAGGDDQGTPGEPRPTRGDRLVSPSGAADRRRLVMDIGLLDSGP